MSDSDDSTEQSPVERMATTNPPYAHQGIILYPEDLKRLGEIMDELRGRGLRGVNKSAVMRRALAAFDPSTVT